MHLKDVHMVHMTTPDELLHEHVAEGCASGDEGRGALCRSVEAQDLVVVDALGKFGCMQMLT